MASTLFVKNGKYQHNGRVFQVVQAMIFQHKNTKASVLTPMTSETALHKMPNPSIWKAPSCLQRVTHNLQQGFTYYPSEQTPSSSTPLIWWRKKEGLLKHLYMTQTKLPSALDSEQWGRPTNMLHISCILAVVHGTQWALIACDAEFAPHGFC
jgi:hypothetical protein